MKTILTTSIIACFCMIAQAQQLDNTGFEVWDNTPQGTEPHAWASNNFMLGPNGGTPLVTQSTDANSGSYAVQLKSDSILDPMTQQTRVLGGFIFTGTAPTGPGTFPVNGMAFSGHIDSLVFFAKYAPVGNDVMSFFMSATKWNPQTNMRDTLGKTYGNFGANAAYSRYVMPFSYLQPGTLGDTLFIQFSSSSNQTAQKGSTLLIDDVMLFANQTGISVLGADENRLQAYPIPVSNTIHLVGSESFSIYTSAGVLVKSVNVGRTRNIELDVTDLVAGQYLIKTQEGTSKKFIKK